jgi:hypothetical protein
MSCLMPQQFGMTALFDDLAAIQYDNTIGISHGG